jgi:hypothetical protein
LQPSNPAEKFWERLLAPYQARDWPRCLRELRPVLDADEDAIVPRLICAALHRLAGQPSLALLQYETLLPLAVGQGDFLRALAAQKHLDALHPAAVSHSRRFEAMLQWFSALRTGSPAAKPPSSAEEVTPDSLLELDPGTFTRLAEGANIESLEPNPRTLEGQQGSVRLVLFGRVQWSITRGEGIPLLEGVAHVGEAILVNPELGEDVRLVTHAEYPAEILCFNADDIALLAGPRRVADSPPVSTLPPVEEPGPAPIPEPELAIEEPGPSTPATPPESCAHEPASRIESHAAGTPGSPRAPRPQPDPRFEPTLATSAPVARRRETRVSVNIDSGIARLGLEDTRVSPIDGRMLRITPIFIELAFPRSELRHLRSWLLNKCVPLRLTLDQRTSVACVARIRWASAVTPEEAESGEEMRLELEFMPMASHDLDRIRTAADVRGTSSPEEPTAGAA